MAEAKMQLSLLNSLPFCGTLNPEPLTPEYGARNPKP